MVGIALVSFGMVCTPGPNMIYLVSRTLVQGRRAGYVSLVGVAAGFLIYMLATCAGISVVFRAVPAAYTALKLAGAAYLLYLAWNAVRPGGQALFQPRDLPPDSARRLFMMGLLTNLLNPKAAVLYLTLLPQFIDPSRQHVLRQGLELGLTQIAVSLSVNSVIIVLAGSLAGWFGARPAWLRVQRFFMATVLGGLAIRVAVERTA